MTKKFRRVFGEGKPVIAMVHLGALPGSPLHDAEAGLEGLVEGARKDLERAAGGRLRRRHVRQRERPALRVQGRHRLDRDHGLRHRPAARRDHSAVRRQRALGPDEHDGARGRDRRVVRARDLHRHLCLRHGAVDARMPARRSATATGSAGSDLAVLYNISAEFAYSLDRRSLADRARSAVFSSIPDAILVSGAITGEAAAMSDLEAVKQALPRHAGARQYRREARDRGGCAEGRRRLHRRLVAEGRRQHLERRSIRSARPSSCGSSAQRGTADAWRWRAERTASAQGPAAALPLRADADPGPQRLRGPRAAAARRGSSTALGIASRTDRLGNLIATLDGRQGAPSVMLFAHMDQLGFVVRKIEANGLVRVERLGGVPEKALPSQAVLFCVGEGRDMPGVIANKSHHATTPEEKYRVLPYAELYIDAGFDSAAEAARRRHRYRHADRLSAAGARARRRPHRRHVGRRPRRLRGDASKWRAR